MIAAATEFHATSTGHGTPGLAREGGGHPSITLRVRDVQASRRFYAELLGFVAAGGCGYSDGQAVLVSPLLANGFRSIVLTRAASPAAATGILLELETTSELLDRYILAKLLGAKTSGLVRRGRTLMTSIQDPDGHRIDLRACHGEHAARSADGRRARPSASRWARHGEEPGAPPEPQGRTASERMG